MVGCVVQEQHSLELYRYDGISNNTLFFFHFAAGDFIETSSQGRGPSTKKQKRKNNRNQIRAISKCWPRRCFTQASVKYRKKNERYLFFFWQMFYMYTCMEIGERRDWLRYLNSRRG